MKLYNGRLGRVIARRAVTNIRVSGNLQAMVREISAEAWYCANGTKAWWMAAIEPPGGEPPGEKLSSEAERNANDRVKPTVRRPKPILALPKGLVDPGRSRLQPQSGKFMRKRRDRGRGG